MEIRNKTQTNTLRALRFTEKFCKNEWKHRRTAAHLLNCKKKKIQKAI